MEFTKEAPKECGWYFKKYDFADDGKYQAVEVVKAEDFFVPDVAHKYRGKLVAICHTEFQCDECNEINEASCMPVDVSGYSWCKIITEDAHTRIADLTAKLDASRKEVQRLMNLSGDAAQMLQACFGPNKKNELVARLFMASTDGIPEEKEND